MKSALLIVLAVCISSVCDAASVVNKTDCLVVHQARAKVEKQIGDKSAAGFIRLANAGHQIVKGSSTVIALRIFEDDNAGVDSQVFTKVTVELAANPAGENRTRKLQVKLSYYTSGGVGFIHRGDFWLGHDFAPAVELAYDGAQQNAVISAKFVATRMSDGTKKDVTLNYSCPLRQLRLRELNEWEGKPSTGWNAFAPPSTR